MKYAVSAVALAAALGFAGVAHAGGLDEGSLKDEPIYHSPTVWSGFYVGITGGKAWSDFDYVEVDDDEEELFPFDLDGGVFGGHVGYNWQRDNLVFGIEGDISALTGDDEIVRGGKNLFGRSVEYDYLATLRARLGVAFDNYLVYGTAGVASVGYEYGCSKSPDFGSGGPCDDFSESSDETETTWVAGAGAEADLGSGLSLRIEYLYVDADIETSDDIGNAFAEGPTSTDELQIVRGGVSYRFGHHREPLESLK